MRSGPKGRFLQRCCRRSREGTKAGAFPETLRGTPACPLRVCMEGARHSATATYKAHIPRHFGLERQGVSYLENYGGRMGKRPPTLATPTCARTGPAAAQYMSLPRKRLTMALMTGTSSE